MAVVTGSMSSGTSGKAIYDLVAAALALNPNWSRPASNPTLTGATDSWGANYTTQVWKCTVGSQVFFVAFSYDTTTNVNDLFIQAAEAYDGSDGAGVPGAKKFRRIMGGGTTNAFTDASAVTPATTDLVSNADVSVVSTSPNWATTNLLGAASAFNFLFKVGNKSVTIGYNVAGANRWVHVGAFESLVTGPSDPIPIGLFTHGINNPVPKASTPGISAHSDGVVARNPGLGVTAESGAFYACMQPLHATALFTSSSAVAVQAPSRGFGASVPRWYTKVLMSQAIIHQSRATGSTVGQTFRGYYSDLFAAIAGDSGAGATEPSGGGIDSVVIDGVTYYWLGTNCPGIGIGAGGPSAGQTAYIAVRAD